MKISTELLPKNVDRPPNAIDKDYVPITMDEQDRCAIWSGFDPDYPLDESSAAWEVPRAVDPLPSLQEYQKYQEEQKALQQYQKDHKNEPLPPDLQKISQQKPMTLFPRKILKTSLLIRLLNDHSGDYSDCPHESTVFDIFLYWCYNNETLTNHILQWCFNRLREEFNTHRNDFRPWLLLMEKLLQQKDKNFEKTYRQWIGEMRQLLDNCTVTNTTGTNLLMFQLLSWFQRLAARIPDAMDYVLECVSLSELIEKYDRSHAHLTEAFNPGRSMSGLSRSTTTNSQKTPREKAPNNVNNNTTPSPTPSTGPPE